MKIFKFKNKLYDNLSDIFINGTIKIISKLRDRFDNEINLLNKSMDSIENETFKKVSDIDNMIKLLQNEKNSILDEKDRIITKLSNKRNNLVKIKNCMYKELEDIGE